MMLFPEILQTKLTPRKPSHRTLHRQRVTDALEEAIHYRLTILQASAGYGKSTALTALDDNENSLPVIWYQVTEDDNNPSIFLLYLLHATQSTFPQLDSLPIDTLQNWDSTQGTLPATDIVHHYLNTTTALEQPVLLILDDVHHILESEEISIILDRLISLSPSNLHILLSSRYPVKLPNLFRWRSQGEIFTLDQETLAFTPEEITQLFKEQYQYELTPQEVEAVSSVTEGWAVALQAIWQSLRTGAVSSIEEALAYQASTMENLFAILVHEVLDQQPEDVQNFLRATSTLQIMTPEACNTLRESNDSAAMLSYLQRQDLFIVDLGNGSLRYQNIFHHLLQQQVEERQRHTWHKRASAYYSERGDSESAIYHAVHGRVFDQAARLLVNHGEKLLRAGRLDTLGHYLDALPPEKLLTYPMLLKYLGDLARLRSQFQESLGWYQQAEALWREQGQPTEVARALRGQARVYLDTVNPSRASDLLQQALKLSDGTVDRRANARLYELLAENKLNAGKVQEAEQLRHKAETLRREGPSESQLLYRVLIRTGQLEEAQNKLEHRAEAERDQPVQTPRAHRETQLLLSLLYAFQGNAQSAYQMALRGTQRGTELGSPFVSAVGFMRQGHALLLQPAENRYAQARQAYEKAIEISSSLSTLRLQVEAYWGLCQVYGHQGQLEKAAQLADKAIEIASRAGDEWITSLVRLAIGASLIQVGQYESAHTWLQDAQRGFHECGDSFGTTAARFWRCFGWFHQNNMEHLSQVLPIVLSACQENHYGFLFTKPSLLGLHDERKSIPLLIQARDQGWEESYARQLLKEMGVPGISIHPGYQLRVHTLGEFRTWRGRDAIPGSGWQRTASRHLFQLLVTCWDSPLEREQIYEHLWPGTNPGKAERNFKVALSTLYRVLEPNRAPGSDSAYIARDDSRYFLRTEADAWYDVHEFTQAVKTAEKVLLQNPNQAIPALEKAIHFYQGEFLPDARYETWAAAEREHLSVLYLRTADHLCELYLQNQLPEQTIRLCQGILAEDNCWERAYRHLMCAYDLMGDHGQVARTYQRCVDTLESELEIFPSSETVEQYQELTS